MRKLILGLLICGISLFAQQPVKNVDGNGNELIFAAGGKAYDSGLTAITTGGITLTAVTTKVQLIHCQAVGAATITITDGAGSPVTYWPAVPMTANSVVIGNYGPVGMSLASGVKMTASVNSAISCRVIGVQ